MLTIDMSPAATLLLAVCDISVSYYVLVLLTLQGLRLVIDKSREGPVVTVEVPIYQVYGPSRSYRYLIDNAGEYNP